jgi:REP element-mobilizing transposase RayT
MSARFKNKYRIESTRLKNWDYGCNATYFVTICTKNREHFFGDVVVGNDAVPYVSLSEIGKIAETEWLKTFDMRPDMNLEMGQFIIMPNHFHAIIGIGINEFNSQRAMERDAQRDAQRDGQRTTEWDTKCDAQRDAQRATEWDTQCDGQRDAQRDPQCDWQRDAQCDGRDAQCRRDAMHCVSTVNNNVDNTDNNNVDNTINAPINNTVHNTVDANVHNTINNAVDNTVNAPINNTTNESKNQFGPQSKNLASIIRGFKIGVTKNARLIDPQFEWQTRFHDHIIRNEQSFRNISEYIKNNPSKWEEDTFH